MKWYLLKGTLMLFPFFISMGVIGNLVGLVSFFIYSKSNKRLEEFLKISIWISFFIGFVFFLIMGMFYATYSLTLTHFMKKWLAIIIVLIIILITVYYSNKEFKEITKKTFRLTDADFMIDGTINPYINHGQVVNQALFSSSPFILISYIFFLIFNGLADTLSFGLNSYLISFFK